MERPTEGYELISTKSGSSYTLARRPGGGQQLGRVGSLLIHEINLWKFHQSLHLYTYILQKFFQIFLKFVEIVWCNKATPRFIQAISGHLNHLMVNKAQGTICQGQHIVWSVTGNEFSKALFHLCSGLGTKEMIIPFQSQVSCSKFCALFPHATLGNLMIEGMKRSLQVTQPQHLQGRLSFWFTSLFPYPVMQDFQYSVNTQVC